MSKMIMATLTILSTTAILLALGTTTRALNIQPAYATPVFETSGASGLASGIEGSDSPQIGLSWTQEFAPGQLAEQHCIGCVTDFAAGQEALDQGLIGPPKKLP
jgi:hypothetical protein